ncbi:hypothetical protein SAMN05421773_103294 [Streptomyces aidingensis]|uniref:Uncharacterized protein n=2 Tax=Streptomyces aidingensis TaxID=910347 RepID=A0A1I1J5E0_9ACTN|nr:hypothetical protein SAMN05421773_103294 [Streptomyces aidingensis]
MHRWCHGTYAMTIPASGPVPVARQRCDCVCHTSPTAGTGAGRTPDG